MAKRVKRLYRSGKDRVIAGVCGGLGDYLEVDPTVVRLIWILSILVGGAGFFAYLLAWLIMPRNPKDRW